MTEEIHILNCGSTHTLEQGINQFLLDGWKRDGEIKIIQHQKIGGFETRFIQVMVYNGKDKN